MMIRATKSPRETEKLADFLLNKFLKTNLSTGRKKAVVVALEGELGVGKTVFTKGFAEALGIKQKIKSPTFNLIKTYKLKIASYKLLYHLDCYRLRNHRNLEVLGIKEILANPSNIVLIEWAERVKKILPKKHIKVHIDHISKNKRKITIK